MTASCTAPGPAEVVQGVQGGPDGATGEEDVVDQHDDLAGQVTRNVGHGFGEDGAQADVVAVEGHIEAADRQGDPLDLAQELGHAGCQRDTAGLQADEHDVLDAPVALDHLVRHAGQRALHVGGRREPGSGPRTRPRGVACDCVRVRPLLLLSV